MCVCAVLTRRHMPACVRAQITLREEYHYDKLTAEHLVQNYGTRALQVADLGKKMKLSKRLVRSQPIVEAEVVFAVRQVRTTCSCRRVGGERGCASSLITARRAWMVTTHQEYALTVTDVVARRTRLAFLDTDAAEKAVDRVTELMAKELKCVGLRPAPRLLPVPHSHMCCRTAQVEQGREDAAASSSAGVCQHDGCEAVGAGGDGGRRRRRR